MVSFLIDTTGFLTPYDIFSMLGGQAFDTASMLKKLEFVKDDAIRENTALTIFERRKVLSGLKSVLTPCLRNEKIRLTAEQLNDLQSVNSATAAFVLTNVFNHVEDFQCFVMQIVKGKLYDYEVFKTDAFAMLTSKKEDLHQKLECCALNNFAPVEVTAIDVIPLFKQDKGLFQSVYADTASKLIAEIECELNSITIDELVQIAFSVCEKKALSAYIAEKSVDAAIKVYTDYFKKLLGYEIFDVEKYIDLACESLINLEEVIL